MICIGYNLICQKCITMQVSCTDIIAYIVSSVRKDLCRHLVCFRPIVFVQCRMYRIHLFCFFFSVCHHGRLDPHPILGNCMLLSVENMWSFMLFLTMIEDTGLSWQSWPKAKIDIFIPTFWRTILNILDFQQSWLIKVIEIVQALF